MTGILMSALLLLFLSGGGRHGAFHRLGFRHAEHD